MQRIRSIQEWLRESDRLRSIGFNIPRHWDSLHDLLQSDWTGWFWIHLTSDQDVSSTSIPNLVRTEGRVRRFVNGRFKNFFVNKKFLTWIAAEQPPPLCSRTLQGHAYVNHGQVRIRYSTENKPMREVKNSLKEASALSTRHLLGDRHMFELCTLLGMYDNPIVEFAVFDKPVGPRKSKLLIWEVRNY